MKAFAKRLDSLRRDGENKRQFAERIGVSPVQLSRYYSGSAPGRKVLERISRKTGVTVDWLIKGGNSEIADPPATRIGARTSKKITDKDRLQMALAHLDQLNHVNRDGREAIKEILRGVVEDPQYRDMVQSYHGFIRFQHDKKKNKGND